MRTFAGLAQIGIADALIFVAFFDFAVVDFKIVRDRDDVPMRRAGFGLSERGKQK